MSPTQRQARAQEVDRQRALKSRIRLDRAQREHGRLKNDPMWMAKNFVAWYDEELDAAAWLSLDNITPLEAAMLLCQFNPHDKAVDPLATTNDKTNPEDFKRLLRAFEDVASADVEERRSLSQWHTIARTKGYKFHPWIGDYERARSTIVTSNMATQAPAPKEIPNYRLATPEELTEAFGNEDGLKRIFDNVTKVKWALEARKVKGVGRKNNQPPRFDPYVFLIHLPGSVYAPTLTKRKAWSLFAVHFPRYYAEIEHMEDLHKYD